MTLAPRWKKLIRDFEALGGRLALVVLAMVFGLVCVIAQTSAYSTLIRDLSTVYRGTNPASGILDIGEVDEALLGRIRGMEGVVMAEPLSILHLRAQQADGGFGRGLLFVVDDPLTQEISKVRLEELGQASGPSILVERRVLGVAGVEIGDTVSLDLPGRGFTALAIAGTVFDPALAPAEQEQAVYAYMDAQTWADLGGGVLEMVKIRVTGDTSDQAHVDATLARIANSLRAEGVNVHLVQIPNAETHPHQNQMTAVLSLFLLFSAAAFLLSTFLVSVTIDGLMLQQIRQIGVLKAIGARQSQLVSIYLVGTGVLGLAALVPAIPIGLQAAGIMAQMVGQLLNVDISSTTPAPVLVVLWIAIGLGGPALLALRPLRRAARMPVTQAISDEGIERRTGRPRTGRMGRLLGGGIGQLALSGMTRNRMRSLLIVTLLAAAGGITLTAANVAKSYRLSVEIAAVERLQDVDLILTTPIPTEAAAAIAGRAAGFSPLPSARSFEAAQAREDGLTIVRTYPDGGHGSLTLEALTDVEGLAHYTLLAGSLSDGFAGGIILNQSALGLLGNPEIGDEVRVSIDGDVLVLPLTAVLRQYMSPARGYLDTGDLPAGFGADRVNTLRLVADGGDAGRLVQEIEAGAKELGSGVYAVISENMMAKAVSGHITILIVMLTALGLMIAAVGFAGMTAAQGISVTERRREFGILRAIGARRQQIVLSLLIEGAVFWAGALAAALILSLPISALVSGMIGRMTFGLPLPFSLDGSAFLLWAAASLAGALAASIPPGLAAAHSSVKTSLNQL